MTKNDLRLLSTESLKQYVKENNPFDYDLMEFAYEILKEERSYLFSEEDGSRIKSEIFNKKQTGKANF